MNCDQFLPAMETGNWLTRLQARRHARSCAACAAVYHKWRQTRLLLSRAEPLSPRSRQLWLAAAQAPMQSRPLPRWPLLAGALAAACLAIVLLKLTIWKSHPTPQSPNLARSTDTTSTGPIRVVDLDAAAQLDQLGADTADLEQQLTHLRRQAQRIQAERQVALVIQRFERW